MIEEPRVTSGDVIALRLFEIAYAVDLRLVETLWAQQARSSTRPRLVATRAKAVTYGEAPVEIAFDPVALKLDGTAVQARAVARLYDFGVLVLALSVPVRNASWPSFARTANELHESVGIHADTVVWEKLREPLLTLLAPALTRRNRATLQEDYLIGVVHEFDRRLGAAALQESLDLVPLLSGEHRALSDSARADLLSRSFSYYTDDLAVLTWDRAFIYEPRGDSDVIDILEVANAELLEMRYYDELLDAELPRMYDLVERTRRTTALFAGRRFARLARRLYTLVAEVTELTEKLDNALQVTEDVYFARVYATALDLFRVRAVSAAVDRKLAIIRDTYAALYDEANSGRSELLEILVIVLIAVEIVLALIRHT